MPMSKVTVIDEPVKIVGKFIYASRHISDVKWRKVLFSFRESSLY